MTPAKLLWAVWLTLALCGAAHGAGSPEKDREILVAFRDSITNWAAVKASGNLEGWDDATPAYLWSGVVLDFDLRVREVSLTCYDFMYCAPATGPLFPDFAKLDRLEVLSMGGNLFTGDLPPGWAAPGAFRALQQLSLTSGRLNGTLPAAWGTLGAFPSLTTLLLDGNNFTGALPAEWGYAGAFPRLLRLDLASNNLGGSLPASWGQSPAFPHLEELSFEKSGVSGQLPPEWGGNRGFANLTHLSLGECRLEGGLPKEWASPDRFPKLVKLQLRQNNLSGALPREWGCDGCWPALTELSLVDNAIGGSLPGSWAKLQALQSLDMGRNRLEGLLPDGWAAPGGLPQLATLDLTANRISGSLPGAWGRPDALPALTWLDVSSNNISGGLPQQWGEPDSLSRLRLLYLQHNHLSGPLPSDWNFNSTLQQLFSLSLAHNELTGTLPDAWGSIDNSLAALYILDLGFNRLSGSLPGGWGTSRSALSSLTTVAIAGNNFTGEIPPNWGLMQDMHYLVLAPGNPTVCRTLPYVGQYVTCFGDDGATCQEPVQLRSNCSSSMPGWLPYDQNNGDLAPLTGLQIGLIVAGVSLIAACSTLAVVLVLRHREQQQWQMLQTLDAELAVRNGKEGSALAAATARKRGKHSALAVKLLKECRIDQADIMFCRGTDGHLVQLGAGAYGQVYKAFLYGVHPVAVKVFQTQDDVPADDFWKEISILRTCRHGNIVQFQGACVDGDTTMMITELMDTDLYRALQTNRVSWYKHGLDVAIDVAQALHFLHCRNIIHFDCKSPNILLSATNSAKLADVGWAQILYNSYITGDGGTFNWAAPEQLIGLKCTAKADVYSYGLVLWELCTRELPVRGQIRDIRIPQEAPQMVADLIRECLDVDPAKRPTMEHIIHQLNAEKARMASGAGPSSAGALSLPTTTTSSSGKFTAGGSSLELHGLDILGSSMHASSGNNSTFGAGISTQAGSSSGGGSGAASLAAAPRRGGGGGASIDSSLWRADSTLEPASSVALSTDGTAPGDGSTGGPGSYRMPIGGSSGGAGGRVPTPPAAPVSAGLMPIGSGSTIDVFDGMAVGAALGGGSNGAASAWHGGSSGQASGGSSTQTGGSGGGSGGPSGAPSVAGSQFVGFEGSPWFTGNASVATTAPGGGIGGGACGWSGASVDVGPSGWQSTAAPAAAAASSFVSFQGSPWAAGRPAAAVTGSTSPADTSGWPSFAGASIGDASIGGTSSGGAYSADASFGGASIGGSFQGDMMSLGGGGSVLDAGGPSAGTLFGGAPLAAPLPAGHQPLIGGYVAAPSLAAMPHPFSRSPWFNGGLSQAGTGSTGSGSGDAVTSTTAAGGSSGGASGANSLQGSLWLGDSSADGSSQHL